MYRLSPPGLMVSMKYPFPLVILMWVYLLLPFLLLNELCTSAVIRDLSRLCGIDVYKVEKSYVWTDVAVLCNNTSSAQYKISKFWTIFIFLSPQLSQPIERFANDYEIQEVIHFIQRSMPNVSMWLLVMIKFRAPSSEALALISFTSVPQNWWCQ